MFIDPQAPTSSCRGGHRPAPPTSPAFSARARRVPGRNPRQQH
jgi:hypothetical protein